MNDIITLLKPRLLSAKNSGLSKHKSSGVVKFLFLGSIGAIFWAGIFAVSLRVLRYFRGIEEVGDIVAFKFLSMMLITSFALLIFSSILTSLSKLYLSRDLNFVHSMPVPSYKIFLARWTDSTIESSWMVIVYILPVLLAYGIAFDAGPFFYASVVMALVPLSMIASSVSSILVMGAVIFIPANRMKTVFIFFGLVLFMVLYMAFRLLRPELLVDPDVFLTALVYMKNLQTPSSPFLPSTWAYDSIKNALSGQTWQGLFHMALSWSCAGTFLFFITMIADFIYFKGFSKTQTASVRLFKNNNSQNSFLNFLPASVRAMTVKEIKTFLRDQTQWTQLFLIAGLIFIYTYNFKVLPLDKAPINTVYLQNLLSFLNMGLALFVLTAITARFGYPAVSAEKDGFWIIKSAPVSIKSFLWIKFFIYYFPLLILTEILIIATNILLDVTPFMMVLSSISVFFMVPGIVSMGIGFGAAYPDFKAENPLQTVMSFGGILFMILCAGFIGLVIILEAGPVYKIFMAGIHEKALTGLDQAWTVISFSIAFIISILAIILPMKFGEKRLSKRFE
ncbi:MAG: hypothetical protein GY749_07185 [Desulfobacteraceae bacterium]|nr:hypothetical protein [Desulfobacteraceae bacterium]